MYLLLIPWLLICLVVVAMVQNPSRENQGLNFIQPEMFVFTGDTPMASCFQIWHYSMKCRKQPDYTIQK